jgi:hypothetical protein
MFEVFAHMNVHWVGFSFGKINDKLKKKKYFVPSRCTTGTDILQKCGLNVVSTAGEFAALIHSNSSFISICSSD